MIKNKECLTIAVIEDHTHIPGLVVVLAGDQVVGTQGNGTVLRMMRELAGSELRNIDLYDYLLTLRAVQMGAQQNMFIIVSNVLRDNKAFAARNLMLIKETYMDITGENIEPIRQEFTQPTSYRNGVELVLFFEIDDVEDYRNLLLEITNTPYYNNVFEMMTNDLINVDRLNYLYARTILPGSM